MNKKQAKKLLDTAINQIHDPETKGLLNQFRKEWFKTVFDFHKTGRKPAKKLLEHQLTESFGNMSAVAKALGVNLKNLERWIREDETGALSEAKALGVSRVVDMAEYQALQKLSEQDMSAIRLILKTLGKSRGYVEQVRYNPDQIGGLDLTQTDSGNINLTVKHVLIKSREDLDAVYAGDIPQVEYKNITEVNDIIEAEIVKE